MCYSNFQIRDVQYHRWGIVSRILALFGKYRISRYQGNLHIFTASMTIATAQKFGQDHQLIFTYTASHRPPELVGHTSQP